MNAQPEINFGPDEPFKLVLQTAEDTFRTAREQEQRECDQAESKKRQADFLHCVEWNRKE